MTILTREPNYDRSSVRTEKGTIEAQPAVRTEKHGVEQVREDYGISMDDKGSIAKLAEATKIPRQTIDDLYDTHKIREQLTAPSEVLPKRASSGVIRSTGGLETGERIKLIEKGALEGVGVEEAS